MFVDTSPGRAVAARHLDDARCCVVNHRVVVVDLCMSLPYAWFPEPNGEPLSTERADDDLFEGHRLARPVCKNADPCAVVYRALLPTILIPALAL